MLNLENKVDKKINLREYLSDQELIDAINMVPDSLPFKIKLNKLIVDRGSQIEKHKIFILKRIRRFLELREGVIYRIGDKDHILRDLEDSIIVKKYKEALSGNMIGFGRTAEVRNISLLPGLNTVVKSIFTPISDTLSSQQESAILREVENIFGVDRIADSQVTPNISVPHPYLWISDGNSQGAYIMQKINGVDIEKFLSYISTHSLFDDIFNKNIIEIMNNLQLLDFKDIERQIDIFVDKMHTVCIHRDIKPANIMIGFDNGVLKFYIIDFGQSVSIFNLEDTESKNIDNMKEAEKSKVKSVILSSIKRAKSLSKKND